MQDLIQQIGMPVFVQIVIECWNSVFLLIMIFSVVLGRHSEISSGAKTEIPMMNEILVFYIALFLYNMFDIFCCGTDGDPGEVSRMLKIVSEIGYFAMGAVQTLIFLQIIKKQIAEKNGMKKLKTAAAAVQLMQLPGLVLLAATPFTNVLYWFDERNCYHRGELYGVWYYTTILTFAFIIGVLIRCRKTTDPFVKKVLLIAALMPFAAFIFNFVYTGISYNNIFVSLAALIIFVLLEKEYAEVTARKARETEKIKTQLAESRNKVLLAQIQPHFIYNSLTVISSYLDEPDKAEAAIEHFSDFLRGSIDVLEETGCIRAERELKTVRDYLYMEKERFGDMLTVVYDLQSEDFFIPAFSVQTLAENAVTHGVRENGNGRGTVMVRSYDSEIGHIIEVEDDGAGFDTGVQKNDGRSHIGLSNLRSRLEMMCEGTLEVRSEPGMGTLARITIPYNAKIYRSEDGNEHTDS